MRGNTYTHPSTYVVIPPVQVGLEVLLEGTLVLSNVCLNLLRAFVLFLVVVLGNLLLALEKPLYVVAERVARILPGGRWGVGDETESD